MICFIKFLPSFPPQFQNMSSPKLRFKPCFQCKIVPSEGLFLLSEQEQLLLRGESYIQLAPFLNGQYTLQEIISNLQTQIPPLEILSYLDTLRDKGYIVDDDDCISIEQAAFWTTFDSASPYFLKRFQDITVSVISVGQINTLLFKTLLNDLHIQVADKGDLWVVLADDYLQEELATFNQEALTHQRPWLLAKPVGTEIWIGPLFVPGKTGCWACLKNRLQGHRKIERYLQKKPASSPFLTPLPVLPSTLQMALGILATETAKWVITGNNEPIEGQIMTFNTLTLEQERHILTRRPQCSHCGDPKIVATNQSGPLILQSQPKSFTQDGGHRSFSPTETLSQFAHHISPITGIISVLQQTSTWNDNQLIPSYVTSYNFDYVNQDLYSLHESLRSGAYGKGKQPTQAKVSALCESIERYSGVFHGDEAQIQTTFKDLQSIAIHPNACMLFSEQQFANREQNNPNGFGFKWVPEPFNETQKIAWSPVWSLTYQEFRYLPTAYCYHGYAQNHQIQFTQANSNGCATGNNKEEAILQGFMELVERDSVALWWYNRLTKPAVELTSFAEPYFQELIAYYQTLQRELWVLDITSDLEIPTFAAISRRYDQASENILLGFGAHFDSKIAILRALTELNQSLPAVFSGLSDLNQEYLYQDRDNAEFEWWHKATVKKHPYLIPNKTLPFKTQADYTHNWSDDISVDVMNCVKIAKAKGLETLVLDQTRPDLGLHVIRVIVPGLRHFWPRFGPGRLYDIPVQMGWLEKPKTEAQLNSQPIFF